MPYNPGNTFPQNRFHHFTVTADKKGYFIEAKPLMFKNQKRYQISVNGALPDILVWDDVLGLYRTLDEPNTSFSGELIRAINFKLLDMGH